MVAQTHAGPDEQQELAGAVEPPCKKFRRSELGAKISQDEEMSCQQLTTETLSCTSPTLLNQTQVELEQQEQEQEQQVEVAAGAVEEPPHKKLRGSEHGTDLTRVESSGALPCEYVPVASAVRARAADELYRQKLVAITPLGRLSVGNQTTYERHQQPPPQDVCRRFEGMAVAAPVPFTESVNRSGLLQYALAPFAPLYRFAVGLKKRARPDAAVA